MAPEKRLIDANALIAMCKDIAATEWNKRAAPISWSDAYEGFIDDIEEQPTVDAVEVVHGRWEQGDYYDFGDVCSLCDFDSRINDCKWSYCPKCGAKMDGGKKRCLTKEK